MLLSNTKMANAEGLAPHGMEPFDVAGENNLGALSDNQQHELNSFKMKTRLENEQYLRQHPEIECLLAGFLRDVLTQKPNNVREFASDHFTRADLPELIEKQLEERQQKLRQNNVLRNI